MVNIRDEACRLPRVEKGERKLTARFKVHGREESTYLKREDCMRRRLLQSFSNVLRLDYTHLINDRLDSSSSEVNIRETIK